jgi:long-chain fatty acid transport protein
MRHIFVAGVLLILLAATAMAGGFQLNEHGARAMANGGAWAARAYDGSAIFFNPAGLAYQKGMHVYLGTTLIAPTASFYGPSPGTAKTDMVSQIFTPINVYGTYEIADGLVAGLGIYNPYGLGSEWPVNWVGTLITEKVDLMTFYITPTIAYQVTEEISVGVGVNVVYGNAKLSRQVDVLGVRSKLGIDASGIGYGFNVGAMIKPLSDLSIGLTYRSSVKVSPSGTATFDPASIVVGGSTVRALPAGDVETELELPSTAFVGVAYKLMDNLEVEVDYQYIGWSSYKELGFTFKADNSTSVSPKNYEDTYILRAGAEYTMGDLQLRLGYLYDNNPVLDKYTEPLLPDSDRNGFNVGFGYKINENLTVDVSYLYLKFDKRTVTGTEVGFDGTYTSSANLFGINFGYAF